MEDYKKKYEEALDRAGNLMNNSNTPLSEMCNDICIKIFPELKESEDERINKLIKLILMTADKVLYKTHNITMEECVSWLEKQGGITKLSEEEQNRFAKSVLSSCALSFINYLDAHSYEGKMCVSNGECEDIVNAFHNAMWDRLHRYYCKYIEKQGKQKPAWGEEDDAYKLFAISAVEDYYDKENPLRKDLVDWLKYLKPQNTWKPSDEQMEVLKDLIEDNNQRHFYPILKSLYDDLEELKEK